MLIVNDKETIVLNSSCIAEVNIHSDGRRILARFDNAMAKDLPIATYSTERKCQKAFDILIRAMAADEVCYMPKDTDPVLNTQLQGDYTQRRGRTNGKTK